MRWQQYSPNDLQFDLPVRKQEVWSTETNNKLGNANTVTCSPALVDAFRNVQDSTSVCTTDVTTAAFSGVWRPCRQIRGRCEGLGMQRSWGRRNCIQQFDGESAIVRRANGDTVYGKTLPVAQSARC